MSDYPQHPSEVLDSLQLELGDIDGDLEDGVAAEPEASEDELRVAALLAREGRFSRVSGEVVDDLLADDDSVDSPLRLRLTAIADAVLEERRLLDGALEPLLVWKREAMSFDHGELVERLRTNLPADVEPPASERLALAETGRVRFDHLAEGEVGRDLVAAWIRTLDLDGATAVAALERSLPELAGAGFSGTDTARRTNAEQFVRGVAERLGVAYPLR
jgi:hypothetical protein